MKENIPINHDKSNCNNDIALKRNSNNKFAKGLNISSKRMSQCSNFIRKFSHEKSNLTICPNSSRPLSKIKNDLNSSNFCKKFKYRYLKCSADYTLIDNENCEPLNSAETKKSNWNLYNDNVANN